MTAVNDPIKQLEIYKRNNGRKRKVLKEKVLQTEFDVKSFQADKQN